MNTELLRIRQDLSTAHAFLRDAIDAHIAYRAAEDQSTMAHTEAQLESAHRTADAWLTFVESALAEMARKEAQ